MKLNSHCRLCSRPLTLHVDDDYAQVGDPLKLLEMVVCDDCGTLQERRARIEAWIIDCCHSLAEEKKMDGNRRLTLRESLISATKKYAAVVAECNGVPDEQWTLSLPEQLYNEPLRWPIILRKFREHCSQARTTASRPAPALPYAD